jgi:Domain of unknown function (DUF4136)
MKLISPRLATAALLIVIAASVAQAQKIKIEFDKSVDFATFKSYAWDPTPQATGKPVLVLAIKAAINEELTKRGLKQVAENPDLYIAMYGAVDSDFAVTYSDFYYGPYGVPAFDQNFLMWGALPGTTNTAVVHKGQLVVDLIDAGRKKLAWRGIATQKLSDQQMKLVGQVNTAVEKLFAQYPPKK